MRELRLNIETGNKSLRIKNNILFCYLLTLCLLDKHIKISYKLI